MAFSLRITAKTKNGQDVELEPSWWNEEQLRSTYNFKKELNYFLDYFIYINKKTFLDIIESQEKYRNKGINEEEDWMEENDHTKAELDDLVQNLQEDSIIKIWIYEWESGLD